MLKKIHMKKKTPGMDPPLGTHVPYAGSAAPMGVSVSSTASSLSLGASTGPSHLSSGSTGSSALQASWLRNRDSYTTTVLVQEDGQCDLLAMDGGDPSSMRSSSRTHDPASLFVDYQATPVLAAPAAGGITLLAPSSSIANANNANNATNTPTNNTTTNTTNANTTTNRNSAASANARYVAGATFFNYQLYGALRTGDAVTLWTRAYRGYAVSAFVSGYVYVAVMYLLLRIPSEALALPSTRRLKNLLQLAWCLVLLVGFVSDSYAPSKLRRKSYMLLGWAMAAVLWLALFVLFQAAADATQATNEANDVTMTLDGLTKEDEAMTTTTSPRPGTITVLLFAAFSATIMATNALDIRVIELSQQEKLQARGSLLATYQIVRISAQVVMHSLIASVVHVPSANDDANATNENNTNANNNANDGLITLPFAVRFVYLHLAIISLVPLYALMRWAHEDPIDSAAARAAMEAAHAALAGQALAQAHAQAHVQAHLLANAANDTRFRATLRTIAQSAQQRVIWQLVLFSCLLFSFGLFQFPGIRYALETWNHVGAISTLVRSCLGDLAFVAMLALWRQYAINTSWRTLTMAILLSYAAMYLTTAALIAWDVVHAPWMDIVITVLRAPFRTLTLLLPFVPAIEIAHLGTEGTTFALLSVCQSVVKLLAAEVSRAVTSASSPPSSSSSSSSASSSSWASSWWQLYFTDEELARNAHSTQRQVFLGALVVTVALLVPAVSARALLPRQKLDAQQLRVYGGYNPRSAVILFVGFVTGLGYVAYLQIARLDDD